MVLNYSTLLSCLQKVYHLIQDRLHVFLIVILNLSDVFLLTSLMRRSQWSHVYEQKDPHIDFWSLKDTDAFYTPHPHVMKLRVLASLLRTESCRCLRESLQPRPEYQKKDLIQFFYTVLIIHKESHLPWQTSGKDDQCEFLSPSLNDVLQTVPWRSIKFLTIAFYTNK